MKNTYLQYGLSIDIANKLAAAGISKTTFSKTSKKNLTEKYRLTQDEITIVKDAIKRKPIDSDVVELLLKNSNYTCCICKGTKGASYIIHHIEEYSKSQDNSYDNLVVLCPNDHDLAHRGNFLTLNLNPNQIKATKRDWEEKVVKLNNQKASRSGDILEIDFLNIERILELYKGIFHKTPETEYSNQLIAKKLITNYSLVDKVGIKAVNRKPITPFIFFGGHGSIMLRYHYYAIFEEILNYLDFIDLTTLLNQNSIKQGLEGKYCYYQGGLYSTPLPKVISESSQMMIFHFSKKPFKVNFLVDPKYFCSNSSLQRTYDRSTYKIFGKIRNVDIKTIDGLKVIVLDIRPYCFGTPDTGNRNRCLDDFDDIFGQN